MTKFFVTVIPPGRNPVTFTQEARDKAALQSDLAKEFGQGVSFHCSVHGSPRPVCRPDHQLEAEAFREGQLAALDGMDLPDGAYFAMADEMGIGW